MSVYILSQDKCKQAISKGWEEVILWTVLFILTKKNKIIDVICDADTYSLCSYKGKSY